MLRYFRGDEDEVDTGIHLRLFGDVGLISGSKSIVRFRVAPHAMTFLFKIKEAKHRKKEMYQVYYRLIHKITEIVSLLTKLGV